MKHYYLAIHMNFLHDPFLKVLFCSIRQMVITLRVIFLMISFLKENNIKGVKHIIYADFFHKYMIEEVPFGRKYFFGRISFDSDIFL